MVLPWPSNIAVWVGAVVFLIPSLFLSVFLMGEAFQWFDKAHWIRITLCTLGNAARETRTHGNVFVLHELDRCDVDTGAKGLALLWQIFSGAGFPNHFFCDSWVVGFWRGRPWLQDVGLERRAWTLSQAVSGSVGSQGAATNVSTLRVGADRSWRS